MLTILRNIVMMMVVVLMLTWVLMVSLYVVIKHRISV